MQRSASLELFRLAIVAWGLSVGEVSAAEHRAEGQLVIATDEVIEDDLYCFGDEVTIDGHVNGDVVAFARLIRVNGTVDGDLIGAAQAIVVNGKIGDDVRMAGQILKVDDGAIIGDDLFAAGFSLEATGQSSIEGELVYAGYQALFAGRVGEDVTAGLGNCEISGSIGGDVELSVGSDQTGALPYKVGGLPPISFPDVPSGLTIRDTARIAGELEYESPNEAEIADGAQVVGETRYERQVTAPPTPFEMAFSVFSRYATLLIVGFGALLIAPKWIRGMSENVKTRPAACLGLGVVGSVGFIFLLLTILVAMIALAVMAGFIQLTGLVPIFIVLGLSSTAMLLAGFWFFTTYLAEIVLSFVAGSWLLDLAKSKQGGNRFLALLVGIVLLAVVSTVPYFGSLVGWLVVLLGVGALVSWLLRRVSATTTPESRA